ncbi:sulfotransferase [Sphingomonas sp. ASY06-1R]|uniref:tetratricopeptide repeat-containing sulfotransferase family protein n=1 Tax=Sphingomonas sp. ASY06-1R TaxID=3445771 RepID=UPI003FA22F52
MTLPTAPVDRDGLLQQAKDLRARQHVREALDVLAKLERAHPHFSRLHQERGHCHIVLRNAPAAVDALQRAVALNPTLPTSWDMLAQLHRMAGDAPRAAEAAARVAMLEALPAPLVVAHSLFADGDLAPAGDVVRAYLRQNADNVGALHLLARILIQQEELAEAETLLRAILTRDPAFHAARLDLAMVLLQRQQPLAARTEAEILLRHAPDNRDYRKAFSAACIALGDYAPVIDLYETLLTDASSAEAGELRLWRANALKSAGRQEEAIADYRAAIGLRPDPAVAWFSLANLKTYHFTDDEVARMRTAEAACADSGMERIYLNFALGKAMEDRADYARSWHYYAQGNAMRHRFSGYRQDVADRCADELQRVCTADFFAARATWGVADAAPIFILGLPRSGSTLIEQILASHSAVEGTQELTEIGRYARELCGADPACGLPLEPAALTHLRAHDARSLGARFLEDTRAYRRLGRPFFIDKMPNNFWHIGLIHLILPNATIIDVRRDPMACGFSNLKQLFGSGHQEFSYDMRDMAGYYRAYRAMMTHWDAVLPERIVRVRYERLVDNIERETRALLDRCALPFEPECLAFHQNDRPIRTPSSEQVRQPIGRAGLDQWRHYAPWLGPLRVALGDAMIDDEA